MKRVRILGGVLVLALLLATLPVLAQTGPETMNFQGRLLDSGGTALDGSKHCLRFRMCIDGADEGSCTATQVWPEPPGYEYHAVTTESGPYKAGLFTVALGSVTGIDPAIMYEQDTLYLEVSVSEGDGDCDGIGETYEVLEPRSQLRTSAYAQRSRRVHTTEADDEALITVWNNGQGEGIWARTDSTASDSAAGYFYHAGSSSVTYGLYGESSSTSGVGVSGLASAGSGSTYGVYGRSNSPSGHGVHGDGATGVFGQSDSTSGQGVYGYASAASGSTYGLYGQSDSDSGYGVYGDGATGVYGSGATGVYGSGDTGVVGESASTSGSGVLGYANATSGTTSGVLGMSDSTSGAGVWGHALATSGETYGVFGTSYSTSGRGVYGYAWATSGFTYGVRGESESTEGRGVYGRAFATSGETFGVYGASDSTSGTAVFGRAGATSGATYGVVGGSLSTSGTGVYGIASATSGTTYGVVGRSYSPDGYGVYSEGNFHATGDITCDGTKSGVVETGDYGKRTLYAMESPENWFEDFGSGQLAEGQAVVAIEAIYAQTVNLAEDYYVFLTPLGDCALYVAEKSTDSFTVRALGGATCSIGFDYRLVARRLGYEDLRLTPAASVEEPPGGEP